MQNIRRNGIFFSAYFLYGTKKYNEKNICFYSFSSPISHFPFPTSLLPLRATLQTQQALQTRQTLLYTRYTYYTTRTRKSTKMGFCEGMAKGFLYLVTLILGVAGLAILGASAYVKINYGDWSELFSSTGLTVALISGAFIFLVAFVGCYGAKNQSKSALFCFFFVVFLFLVVQVIAGLMFASYMGKLDDVTKDGSKTIQDAKKETEAQINDFIYSVYNKCCDGKVAPFTAVQKCNAPSPQCLTTALPALCACFVDEDKNLGDGVCTIIDEAQEAGSDYPECTVVAAQYKKNIQKYLEDNIEYISIFAGVLGGIELLCLFFACFLMCQNKEEFYEDSV